MIAWPASRAEAQAMPRLELEYVRCLDCEHIYNAAFTYDAVPYVAKPNLMFNRGANWTGFLQTLRKQVLAVLPEDPTVVEIGHGDGTFSPAWRKRDPGAATLALIRMARVRPRMDQSF